MQKTFFSIRKTFASAERHRRTPQTSATGGKEAEGEKSADIGRHRQKKSKKKHIEINEMSPKWVPKSTQRRPKINQKSRLRRGCVSGASWAAVGERFAPKVPKVWSRFWTHFGSKVEKKASKNLCKNRCRKKWNNDAKMGPTSKQNH